MPAEEHVGLLRYLLDHVWVPLMALIGALWVMLHSKIDGIRLEVSRVADKSISKEEFVQHVESEDRVQARIASDLEEHRHTFTRIFDQLRENEQLSTERHIELLKAINGGTKK